MFNLSSDTILATKCKLIPEWHPDPKPWTAWPFKAMLTSTEAHFLYRIAKDLGPINSVNLGMGTGGSTAFLAFGLKEGLHNGKIYTVDNCSHYTNQKTEIIPNAIEQYKALNIDNYIEVCLGESTYWAGTLGRLNKGRGLSFDFIFVDAGHSFSECQSDFLAWFPYLNNKGFIAFHDTHLFSVQEVIRLHVKPHCIFRQQVAHTQLFQKNE